MAGVGHTFGILYDPSNHYINVYTKTYFFETYLNGFQQKKVFYYFGTYIRRYFLPRKKQYKIN